MDKYQCVTVIGVVLLIVAAITGCWYLDSMTAQKAMEAGYVQQYSNGRVIWVKQ